MSRVDTNGDGFLSFSEFYRFLLLLPLDDQADAFANARKAFDFWTGMILFSCLHSLSHNSETAHVDVGLGTPIKQLPSEAGLSPLETIFAAGVSGASSSTATAPLVSSPQSLAFTSHI